MKKLEETLYKINYDTLMMSFEEADALIREMLKEFVRVFTARMLENDMIAVVFDHDDFNFSITIPFMKKKDFTVAVIQEAFFRVAQSYKYSLLSRHRNLRAYVQIQKIPVGAGRRALQPHEKKKYIPKKVEKAILPFYSEFVAKQSHNFLSLFISIDCCGAFVTKTSEKERAKGQHDTLSLTL